MALTAYLALHQVVVGGIGMQADVAAHTPNPVANLVQPLRTYFALFGIGRLLLTVLGKAPLSVPLSLTHGGPFPSFGPLDLRVLLPAVIVALLVVVACHQISRGRLMGLALAMFLINLIPASNLVVTPGVFVAERFLYLPFVGLGLAAAITWDSASTCFATDARVKRLGLVAVGGFIVVWGGLASERATIWKSEETISESMGQCFPWQGTWWDRVGQMNMEKGDLERAWECFERSAAIDPNDAETLGHLGAVLGRLGRWEESSLRLRRAAEMAPSNPEIRIALARALLTLGEKQAALEEARAGHALRPSLFAGHQVFATALFENGRYEEAAREFRQLLLQRPESAPLRQAYISSLSREGRLEEAEAAARDASRQIPSDPQFDLWSARLATRMGRRDQAFAALEEAKRKSGPVAVWLEKVDDLKSLRDDPRARALGAR